MTRMRGTKSVQPLDAEIGAKIKLRRLSLDLSQSDLASLLGISVLQVKRYETGKSRLSAGRLHAVAVNLGVTVTNLLAVDDAMTGPGLQAEPPLADPVIQFLSTPDGLRLNEAFAQVKDRRIRQNLVDLVHAVAEQCNTACSTLTTS